MIALCAFAPALAADVLFPRPLHIVRRVEDPVSNSTATIHEYCAGDQIVTVNGPRVAIADYGRQTLTEIDRSAGTYSVTRFDDLAKAQPGDRLQAKSIEWKTTPLGVRGARNGRSLETFEITRGGEDKMSIEIGVDRAMRLSKNAIEVLIGASYPNPRRQEHDAILGIARGGLATKAGGPTVEDYALPYEQNVSIEVEGTRITMRNVVLEVRNELAPNELVLIPPGARKVESPTTRYARELRELDQLPSRIQQQPQSQP